MAAFLGGLCFPHSPLPQVGAWPRLFSGLSRRRVGGNVATPRNRASSGCRGASASPIPTAVKWIAVYGMLTGLGVSATTTFLPPFRRGESGLDHCTSRASHCRGRPRRSHRPDHLGIGFREMAGARADLAPLGCAIRRRGLLLALASADMVSSWVLDSGCVAHRGGCCRLERGGDAGCDGLLAARMVGRGTGLAMLGFLTGSVSVLR